MRENINQIRPGNSKRNFLSVKGASEFSVLLIQLLRTRQIMSKWFSWLVQGSSSLEFLNHILEVMVQHTSI